MRKWMIEAVEELFGTNDDELPASPKHTVIYIPPRIETMDSITISIDNMPYQKRSSYLNFLFRELIFHTSELSELPRKNNILRQVNTLSNEERASLISEIETNKRTEIEKDFTASRKKLLPFLLMKRAVILQIYEVGSVLQKQHFSAVENTYKNNFTFCTAHNELMLAGKLLAEEHEKKAHDFFTEESRLVKEWERLPAASDDCAWDGDESPIIHHKEVHELTPQ